MRASIFRTSISERANALTKLLGSATSRPTAGLICTQCRARTISPAERAPHQPIAARLSYLNKTRFYSTASETEKRPSKIPPESTEPLPSEREEQRWGTSKHFSQIMDDLQAKLVLYTQRMNTYTGTDYSGIEALRRDIKASEAMVKDRLNDVRTAKESVDKAHIQQASSQKEVVGLLERKHSWSAGDLERYMSLIRSEHVNEQAIQTAKDGLAGAERGLEEVRTRLEKKERQQYHEEQIWSDTIRRNSTWVTIGLMGLNIALLLSNVAIIEPRRRRRLVREIKAALAEQTEIQLSNTATGAEEVSATVETTASDSVETPNAVSAPDIAGIEQVLDELPVEALEQTSDEPGLASGLAIFAQHPVAVRLQNTTKDLFSDRTVPMKKVDQTVLAIESAAAGAMVMALLLLLIKPS